MAAPSASPPEAAATFATQQGSQLEGVDRHRYAAALIRALAEAELQAVRERYVAMRDAWVVHTEHGPGWVWGSGRGRVTVQPHKYTNGHYLVVRSATAADTTHRIIFETDGKVVTRFRSGRMPEVAWVEGCS